MDKILVSSCLLGVPCRYDGNSKPNEKVMEFLKGKDTLGICPEVMGGLKVPRDPAEFVNGKIITNNGKDVTKEYQKGASIALEIARSENVDLCILKANSPSCGCGKIYDGTFSGTLKDGNGCTADLLTKHGFKVVSENEIDSI